MTPEKVQFEKFLTDSRVPGAGDPAQRQKLFREFLEWKRTQPLR
jgi:hypothetical protein